MEFLKAIWNHPLVAAAAGAGLGALGSRLWQQYLQRMVTVRWSVIHETLAAGGDSPVLGRVEILHNGKPVGNLIQWCKVEIENESGSRDLSDVVVRLQYDPGTAFLSGGGALEGSNQALPIAPSFAAEIDRFLAIPEADQKEMTTDFYCRREYLIPVLNRRAKANALFLVIPTVSNPDATRLLRSPKCATQTSARASNDLRRGSSTRQLDRTGRWSPGRRGRCNESHEYLGCRGRGAIGGLVRATPRCRCDPRLAMVFAGDRMSIVFR